MRFVSDLTSWNDDNTFIYIKNFNSIKKKIRKVSVITYVIFRTIWNPVKFVPFLRFRLNLKTRLPKPYSQLRVQKAEPVERSKTRTSIVQAVTSHVKFQSRKIEK